MIVFLRFMTISTLYMLPFLLASGIFENTTQAPKQIMINDKF